MRRFVRVFGEFDAVVCPSGSCAAMVHDQYGRLAELSGDAELADAVAALAPRVHELSQFLVDVLGIEDSARTSRIASPTTRRAIRCGC